MRRTSLAIAMSLRHYTYASEAGARYNTYPNGGTRTPDAVLVEYTPDERAANARQRDALLTEWREVDPVGHDQWRAATDALSPAEPLTGWAEMIRESYGVRVVDPCRFCRSCRSR
ncbi:hypothetical protein [Streptomyces wuyuanensis]|uniref:hypothetical protein n=1 Tax=Streptomyces wuyuanensis TaxID=1196353 RepID=UPI0034158344